MSRRQGYGALPRYPLRICASLVQNPLNLGALCRTVEAFCLESLVLPDLALVEDWEFRKLAVSTHHWQPLSACPPHCLIPWITTQQQAGFAVLALTAHPQAHGLTTFQFPQKTVLVLGRELTGIPDPVRLACNASLVIPQFGMVDSLNVQTATAIAIYEYVRQHAQARL